MSKSQDHDETLSRDAILEGAWYALEQAGRLLRSANTLYRAGDWGTAAALAMFACEEVGRHGILLELAVDGGAQGLRASEIRASTEKDGRHEKKHHRAVSSVSLNPASRNDPLAIAMRTLTRPNLEPAEYNEAERIVRAAAHQTIAHLPAERHSMRTAGLYVGLGADCKWQRPVALSQIDAWHALTSAANDYSSRFRRATSEMRYATPTLENARAHLVKLRAESTLAIDLVEPEWPETVPM